MKVQDAKKIINLVESFNFHKDLKSLRNDSITISQELEIMKKAIESKTDDEILSVGVSASFLRMKKQYEYLKDL